MLSVSIVVVSYGSAEYLPVCLTSLFENVREYGTARVALVENKLDAETLAATRQAIEPYLVQGLQFYPAPTNLGYGGGANWGWQQLDQSSEPAAIQLVLNPDMEFPAGWLSKLLVPFETDPAVGIVGCKLLDARGRIQHAGGILLDGLANGSHFGYGKPDDGRWDESGEVAFVTGAVLAIRRELNQQMSGFDPAYFPGYYEDVDLCWRVRQTGYKVWYNAAAVANHYEGGAFGRGTSYYLTSHRNRLRFVLKHWSTRQLLGQFLPAEGLRLRGTLDPRDRTASSTLYAELATTYLKEKATDLKMSKPKKTPGVPAPSLQDNPQIQLASDMLDHVEEVKAHWLVKEQPFQSRLPFVAKLRERFNSISTRWYVQPILAQQVEFNGAVFRTLDDLGKLTAGSETACQMEVTLLSSRLLEMEDRLARIESLLEKLVPPSEEQKPS